MMTYNLGKSSIPVRSIYVCIYTYPVGITSRIIYDHIKDIIQNTTAGLVLVSCTRGLGRRRGEDLQRLTRCMHMIGWLHCLTVAVIIQKKKVDTTVFLHSSFSPI